MSTATGIAAGFPDCHHTGANERCKAAYLVVERLIDRDVYSLSCKVIPLRDPGAAKPTDRKLGKLKLQSPEEP